HSSVQRRKRPTPPRQPIILVIKGQHHRCRPADNLAALHRPVKPRIKTVIAIVPHHEVITLRNLHRTESPRSCQLRRNHHFVRSSLKLLCSKHAVASFCLRQPCGTTRICSVLDSLAVDDQLLISHFDCVPRQADHSLHQPLAIVGRVKHHYIATPWIVPLSD